MYLKSILPLVVIIFVSLLFTACSDKFDGTNGVKTVYFPNSKVIKQIVNYKNGKREGTLKEFYGNGNLKMKQIYRNDTLNDSSFHYYENGKIAEIQYLKNCKKEGAWKTFNEQGQLFSEINYKEDELDGISKKYTYRSLKLVQQFNYKQGKKDGKQELYYPNGKLKSTTYFSDDKPCLGTEEWDENGEQINNDFTISITERNSLLLNGKLTYIVKLSNPKRDDRIYVLSDKDSTDCLTRVYGLTMNSRDADSFYMDYTVAHGGFIMEKVKIGAYRTTAMGNIFIKTKVINVSANNY